jgi:hypothetical protein
MNGQSFISLSETDRVELMNTSEYFLLNSNAAKQPDYRVADFTAVGVFLVVAGMGRR